MKAPQAASAKDRKRVLFMGSKPIGLRVLRALRATASDELIGALVVDDREDDRSVLPELIQECDSSGVPMHVVGSQEGANRRILELSPDIAIVVGWYWFIPTKVLQSVPLGFLGLHNSLLPKYRGASPLVWAIIYGESRAGISLFKMTPKLDEGAVYGSRSTPIRTDDTIGTVLARLEDAAEELFHSDFQRILDGRMPSEPQDHTIATSYPQRSPDDGLIDWSEPAAQIHDFVRAQTHPYPGAFTGLAGDRLAVWKTAPSARSTDVEPGVVVEVGAGGALVASGQRSTILIQTVGTPGGPDQPVSAVITRPGRRLEPPGVSR